MTEQPNQSESASFRFVRHVDAKEEILTWPDGGHAARKSLAESLNAKNVSFLLGAGCSSAWKDDVEVGIPTMGPLSRDFVQKREEDVKGFPTKAEREFLTDVFGIDLGTDEYARNLERLMEVLFSLRFILEKSAAEDAEARLDVINSLIEKVQTYLWMKCTQGAFSKGDETVLDVYTTFYRKLVLRDRSLPRPWVFTTNYDLFNETAMDRLSLTGFLEL